VDIQLSNKEVDLKIGYLMVD